MEYEGRLQRVHYLKGARRSRLRKIQIDCLERAKGVTGRGYQAYTHVYNLNWLYLKGKRAHGEGLRQAGRRESPINGVKKVKGFMVSVFLAVYFKAQALFRREDCKGCHSLKGQAGIYEGDSN